MREVNEPELDYILKKISAAISDCYSNNEFVRIDSISSNGILDFGFSPYAIKEDFQDWIKKNNLSDSNISGPPANTNLSLAKSLDRKLKKEAQQLQKNAPGLIILNVGVTYFLYLAWEVIAEYMENIMASWEHKNVIGVVLINDETWNIEVKKIRHHSNSLFIEAPMWELYSRKMLLSLNPKCNIEEHKINYITDIIEGIPEYNML